MQINKPKIVIIQGPTAVGKSGIGIELAKYFDGEIISADSMQIYKGFDIGTGKVTIAEMQGIRHHMLDILQPNSSYSVAEFCSEVINIITNIIARKKLPIIVGGTGLFVSALLNGYSFGNVENKEVRTFYENYLAENGREKLFNILVEKDKTASDKIDPNKTRAVIRALEIIDCSGKKFSEISDSSDEYDYLLIALTEDRDVLYDRINRRVDIMFNDGLVNEVSSLLSNGTQEDSQSMRGIGYKEVIPFLKGEYELNRAIELVKQHARNYAKRQFTWLRKMNNVQWFKRSDIEDIKLRIEKFIKE